MRRCLVFALIAVALALPGAAGARRAGGTVLVTFDDGRMATVDVAAARVHQVGRGATAAWSPDGRGIALARDGDLFVISPDGRQSRRLTRDELVQFEPVWSPNGRKLAYLQQHAETVLGIPPQVDVVVVDVASGHARQLTFDAQSKSTLSWSPDGRRLVYEIHRKALGTRVAVIDPTTGAAIRPELELPYPIWSPDGRSLAYVKAEGEALSLFVAEADGSRARVLFRGARDVGLFDAAWSHDGRLIAFVYGAWSVSHSRLELADAVTGRVRPLTSARGHVDTAPSWSPDSRRIAFARYESARKRYAVAVVGLAARDVHVLVRTRHFGRPLWRPRGH